MSPLSPDNMAWAQQPPKQPVPCQNSHQISSKKPKKKAEVRVQRAQVISIGNLPITEPKGRDAHAVQTTVYTEARGCSLSASCFRPITWALDLKQAHTLGSRTLCRGGGGGYMIPFVTQPPLEIQGPYTNLFKRC